MPARLVQVTLHNDTPYPMRWITDHLDHGDWQDPWYPSNLHRLEPGQQGAWRSESAGILTGTKGWALFGAELPEEDLSSPSFTRTEFVQIKWSRPYVGNFGFEISATRSDPREGGGGDSVFVASDTRPALTQIVPVDLGSLGSGENIVGQILSAGIISPLGALWSGTGPGEHVRLGVALRARGSTSSALAQEPGRRVRAVVAHTSKVLDVFRGLTENLTPIVQANWHGADNQRWVLHDLGDGSFRIVAAHSGKVLDVYEGSPDNLVPILQYEWHGGNNQRWRIEDVGDGLSRIVSANSGRVLDVRDGSGDDLAPLVQYDWHGGPNQRWRLEDV